MAFSKIHADAYGLTGEQLFSGATDGTQNIFEIPEYQRPYVWKKEHWEALFTDITDNELGYFIGAIICVCKENNRFDVVDGQQRLTTLSIFLAAIYSVLKIQRKNLKDKLSEEEFDNFWENHIDRFSQIKRSLTVKTYEGKFRTRVLPQNEDNIGDYICVLINAGLIDKNSLKYDERIGIIHDKVDGRRLIPKAYEYFKKCIVEYAIGDNGKYKEDVAEQINRVVEILSKLNSAQLVMIKADSHSSANTLFEALNNRGEPLTITDLVKNRLFAALKKLDEFKKYRNNLYTEIQSKKSDYSQFLERIEAFKNYDTSKFSFENTISVDLLGIISKQFPELLYNSQSLLNPDEIYNSNVEKIISDLKITNDDFDYFIQNHKEQKSSIYFEIQDSLYDSIRNFLSNMNESNDEEGEVKTSLDNINSTTIHTKLKKSQKSYNESTHSGGFSEKSKKDYERRNTQNDNAGKSAEEIAYYELKKTYKNLIWHSKNSHIPADRNNPPPNGVVCDMWNSDSEKGNLYFEVKSSTTEFELSIRSNFEFCNIRTERQEPAFRFIHKMKQKCGNAVKEMPEHSCCASCAVINQVVVQLHD